MDASRPVHCRHSLACLHLACCQGSFSRVLRSTRDIEAWERHPEREMPSDTADPRRFPDWCYSHLGGYEESAVWPASRSRISRKEAEVSSRLSGGIRISFGVVAVALGVSLAHVTAVVAQSPCAEQAPAVQELPK